jgi:hypothetical protein
MNGLLDMVMFHVRDGPDIARVFPEWVARILPRLFAIEIFFPGILLRNPDCVEIIASVLHCESDVRNPETNHDEIRTELSKSCTSSSAKLRPRRSRHM